jgi:hypothetical protein
MCIRFIKGLRCGLLVECFFDAGGFLLFQALHIVFWFFKDKKAFA